MVKKLVVCLVVAGLMSAGFTASGHAFACICEGRVVFEAVGADWLNRKGDFCGASFTGGNKGDIKNDISSPHHFMSPKYYSDILNGKVESDYDPDSGWRCVKRNTY